MMSCLRTAGTSIAVRSPCVCCVSFPFTCMSFSYRFVCICMGIDVFCHEQRIRSTARRRGSGRTRCGRSVCVCVCALLCCLPCFVRVLLRCADCVLPRAVACCVMCVACRCMVSSQLNPHPHPLH